MKTDIKKYLALGLTLLCVAVLSIIVYFCIGKYAVFIKGFKSALGIISPFIYGGAAAYILSPLCNHIEERITGFLQKTNLKKERIRKLSVKLSIFFAYVFVAFLIFLFVKLVAPQIMESLKSIISVVPQWINMIYDFYTEISHKYPQLGDRLDVYVHNIYSAVSSSIQSGELLGKGVNILVGFSSGVMGVAGSSLNLIVAVIASIYILNSRKMFKAQFKKLIYALFNKNTAEIVLDELRFVDMSFNGFIIGKIIDSFIIGIIAFVVLYIMNMPYVALLAIIIGVTNIIPFFGPIIGAIPGVILILFTDPLKALYFLIFVFCLQQFDGNILGPKILGDKVGIPSFWVLFSIMVFGSLWGFAGMIVGVPLFAVIMDITGKLVNRSLKKKNMSCVTEDYMRHENTEGKKE